MSATPAVSVVMATYRRPHLLPYSIGSLLRGTWQDWELIVVGDGCTDSTAAVVEGFGDPRIRFLNLERNFGEQSGPNNVGVEQARGRYLAFLNQDDLWFPDHLQHGVSLLAECDVDLVFGMGLAVGPGRPHSFNGACSGRRQPYAPWMFVPASLWVMKAALARDVGPWRPASEIRNMPSQDWLHRAHRRKARLLADPAISTVLISSGVRPNSYVDRDVAEHELWFRHLDDAAFLRQVVAQAYGAHFIRPHLSVWRGLRRVGGTIARRSLLALGVWPPEAGFWLKYGRKGSFLRHLRKVRGL